MRKNKLFCTPWFVLGLCIAPLLGCGDGGPELTQVRGILLSKNGPVPDASITFFPAVGRPSYGKTDDQGAFELMYNEDRAGAVIGEHTVKIMTGASAPPPPGPPGPSGSGRQSASRGFTPPREITLSEPVVVEKGMETLRLELD